MMSTDRLQIYRCQVCRIVVEVLDGGAGELACCGRPMLLLKENSSDAAREKHVPVLARTAGGVKVSVGSVPHPMEPKHYIEWIELVGDGCTCRRFLQPGQAPQADFEHAAEGATAREYCNLHGLWKS